MQIGKYKIHQINSGTFKLDGGAMFGIIPKTLWERNNPADEVNRVTLAARLLLLISENKKILIDTGMGEKWDEKSKFIYDIEQKENALLSSLAEFQIDKNEITDVILTHLHFDHAGGAVIEENGKLIPAFPNAKYFVQKQNFEWAKNPSDRDRGSYLKQNFIPLYEAGVLNLLDGNSQIDDEIETFVINGHTFGQQLVKISDSSNTILYSGDLLPFSSHIHLPYIMGYDLQPVVTLEEKKKYLRNALEEDWKLFFEHDPFSAYVTVEQSEKGYKIKEKFEEI